MDHEQGKLRKRGHFEEALSQGHVEGLLEEQKDRRLIKSALAMVAVPLLAGMKSRSLKMIKVSESILIGVRDERLT